MSAYPAIFARADDDIAADEKGPAEGATSPSHGLKLPSKGNTDMDRNSTVATARQEKDRRIVASLYEIEGDMYDLVNMTRIMADLLSSELREFGHDESCVTVKIGKQHWEMVNFAFNDCVVRANAFRAKFIAAMKGGAA